MFLKGYKLKFDSVKAKRSNNVVLDQNRQQWGKRREFYENKFIMKGIKLKSKYLGYIIHEEKEKEIREKKQGSLV